MKKRSFIVPVLLILVFIAGCSGDNTKPSASTENPDKPGITASKDSAKTAATNANASDSQQGAEVIVKSTGKLSSKEKEAVLNDISQELDTLVQTINTMEDATDEDLNF
jgi:PBP1b-binding outer membrane lipoprotein LpoB